MPKDIQGRSAPKAFLSCETCRRRKVKCKRPESTSASVDESSTSSAPSTTMPPGPEQRLPACLPCLAIGEECVTVYNRRRRGPPGSAARSMASQGFSSNTPPNPPSAGLSAEHNQTSLSGANRRERQTSQYSTPIQDGSITLADIWGPDPTPNDRISSDQHRSIHLNNQAGSDFLQWSQNQTETGDQRLNEPTGPSHQLPDWNSVERDHVPSGTRSGLSDHHRLALEEVIPRDTAVYMISLYFDYVHALVPCVHRPTFLQRMHQRDDEVDPGFFALLMSVLAATIVHVPKALLPFQDEAPIDIATRCMRASRAVSVTLYDPPSLVIVTIRYFDSVFASLTGQPGAWAAALSEVRGLSIQMNLHRESSYTGLDPVGTELRRRIFQIAFMADKSAACMQDQLIMLRTEDCDAYPPREIDDEYFNEYAYLEQPDGTTSKMAGHRVIAQTFAIIGDLITMRRATARANRPCQAATVLAQLRLLDSLNHRLLAVFSNLPEPLQLETPISSSPLSAMSVTSRPWECQALSDLNVYLSNLVSTTNDPPTSEAWRVMQGNCHVTRAIARLILISCRDEILASSGDIGTGQRAAAERVLFHSYQINDRKDNVISDLLYALKRIPMQPLSVNSRSIVNKIRFVAVTLLDSVIPLLDGSEVESTAAATNKDALLSFLNILSEIEQGLVNDYSSAILPKP